MKLTGLKSGTPVQRFHNAFVICQACSHKMTEERAMIYTFFIFVVFTGLTFVSVHKLDSDYNSAVFIEQVYQ